MERGNLIQKHDVVNYQINNTLLNNLEKSEDTVREESFAETLSSEVGHNLAWYIGWLGFINDPNTIILSSRHSYYYDPEELTNVRTIINLKELNHVKEIRNFLHSISHTLQSSSNFIGYFTDNKQYISLTTNPIIIMFHNIMDSHINRYMSKKDVTQLLEEYGFKVLDMTELNGLTYFHARVA